MVSEKSLVEFALSLVGAREVETVDLSGRRWSESGSELRLFFRGEKLFLAVWRETEPLKIETRCDRQLGNLLQERYESVMAGRILGMNSIEIICSGQLGDDEVRDLVRHAFEIAVEP